MNAVNSSLRFFHMFKKQGDRVMLGFCVDRTDGSVSIELPAANAASRRLVSVAHDPEAELTAIVLGRLYYRGPTAKDPADEAINVYRQRGVSGLENLEGEFSLLIVDARRHVLVGQRDPAGSWPLYWSVSGRHARIGTSLTHVAGAESASIDGSFLANYLTQPFLPCETTCEETMHPNVSRVLPGSIISIRADNACSIHRYWDWKSRICAVEESSFSDVCERFGELLTSAIRERIADRNVASHLSGGMDSTAVSVAAARETGVRTSKRVTGISLLYHAPELRRELEHIEAAWEFEPQIERSFIYADGAKGFDWFETPLPAHDEPYVGLWAISANRLLATMAKESRCDTVLTGFGGDDIQCSRPLRIASLIRRGQLLAAYHEAARWANARGASNWTLLKTCGIVPAIANRWPSLALPQRMNGMSNLAPWISPGFVREQNMLDRVATFRRLRFCDSPELSEIVLRISQISGDWSRWYLHAPLGIHVSHPFLDPRLVTFCLGISPELRCPPEKSKPLLAESMRRHLPDKIRTRREKVGFDGPHTRGLLCNLAQIEKLIERAPICNSGVFSKAVLLKCVRETAFGQKSASMEILDRSLALLACCDLQPDFGTQSNSEELSATNFPHVPNESSFQFPIGSRYHANIASLKNL